MKANLSVKFFFVFILVRFIHSVSAQHENKNWYFGNGTDGIIFNNNIPVKVSNKHSGTGYEGMVVISDPFSGNLLFYSDGASVINQNHTIMANGTGLTGHYSGAQCVQCCPVPGSCLSQFYLFTNSAYDNQPGTISYSIIDFTSSPLGAVTNKNTPFWPGPSDEGMCIIKKQYSNDYWIIANVFNTADYYVWPVTSSGIGLPVIYPFTHTGCSYQINFSELAQKIIVTGWGNKHVTTIDFNPATGTLSNEMQLAPLVFGNCYGARLSKDGTKLYVGVDIPGNSFWQYNFNTGNWINMNSCCNAHDIKMGPDGKMYFIHTYNSSQPIGIIDYPDSTANGNICNYHTLSFSSPFNGEVRRFPEFLIYPDPVDAIADTFSVNVSTTGLNVLGNDFDPQGDSLMIDSIISGPYFGSATVNNNQISFTADTGSCGETDTIVYRLKDINCSYDTAVVLVFINCNPSPSVSFLSSDTSFCGKKCLDFFDLSTNNPTSWQWFFPGSDSLTCNLQNPSNICYNSYGSFDVTLIACNAGGCDTLTLSNFINEFQLPAVPIITINVDTLFCTPAYSYQWYYNYVAIAGATNPYYIFQQQGIYYVIVTDSNGCAASSHAIVTTIGEVENGHAQITVTPNPTDGSFEISLTHFKQVHSKLKIVDTTGRIAFESELHQGNNHILLKVADGIYFLEIRNDNFIGTKKIVVVNN